MTAQIIPLNRQQRSPNRAPSSSSLNAPRDDAIYPWPWLVLDDLPFVDPAKPTGPKGRLKRNCWNDKATESGVSDYWRGRRYARMMLAAMKANNKFLDGIVSNGAISADALTCVFESMIEDAVNRQKKGGKGSRTIVTSAMSGFLRELTHNIAAVER
jgi:hypothetical protein